jgi:hypothetical protein
LRVHFDLRTPRPSLHAPDRPAAQLSRPCIRPHLPAPARPDGPLVPLAVTPATTGPGTVFPPERNRVFVRPMTSELPPAGRPKRVCCQPVKLDLKASAFRSWRGPLWRLKNNLRIVFAFHRMLSSPNQTLPDCRLFPSSFLAHRGDASLLCFSCIVNINCVRFDTSFVRTSVICVLYNKLHLRIFALSVP